MVSHSEVSPAPPGCVSVPNPTVSNLTSPPHPHHQHHLHPVHLSVCVLQSWYPGSSHGDEHGPADLLHVHCSADSFNPRTVLLLYHDLVTFTTLVYILYIIYIYIYVCIRLYIYIHDTNIYTVICYSAHYKIHV